MLSIAWEVSAFNPSLHTGWERGGQFLLITSQCTSTICTVTSIQGNDVCCYLHRWSHEFWDHNSSLQSPKRKHVRILQALISFFYKKKKCYKKMDLSQIKEQLQNNNGKALGWSNEWKRDQNYLFFFSEDHFLSLTAKTSNTVNCTLKHLCWTSICSLNKIICNLYLTYKRFL